MSGSSIRARLSLRRSGGGECGQAPLRAPAVLLEVPSDQGLDRGAVVGVEISAADEVLGQRSILPERPCLKGRDELSLIDQPVLQGEESEQQVTRGIGGSWHRDGPRPG